jgi:hypothetical protein
MGLIQQPATIDHGIKNVGLTLSSSNKFQISERIAAAQREALELEIAGLKAEAEWIAEEARESVVLTGFHQTSSISMILNSLTA